MQLKFSNCADVHLNLSWSVAINTMRFGNQVLKSSVFAPNSSLAYTLIQFHPALFLVAPLWSSNMHRWYLSMFGPQVLHSHENRIRYMHIHQEKRGKMKRSHRWQLMHCDGKQKLQLTCALNTWRHTHTLSTIQTQHRWTVKIMENHCAVVHRSVFRCFSTSGFHFHRRYIVGRFYCLWNIPRQLCLSVFILLYIHDISKR